MKNKNRGTRFYEKWEVVKLQWSASISIQWKRIFYHKKCYLISLLCFHDVCIHAVKKQLLEIKFLIEFRLHCIDNYDDDCTWREVVKSSLRIVQLNLIFTTFGPWNYLCKCCTGTVSSESYLNPILSNCWTCSIFFKTDRF